MDTQTLQAGIIDKGNRTTQVVSYLPSIDILTANVPITAAAWTDLCKQTGIIDAGVRFKIRAGIWYSSSGSIGVPRFRLNAPANTGLMRLVFMAYQSSVAPVVRFDTAFGNSLAAQANSAGAAFFVSIEAIADFTASGVVVQAEKNGGGDSDFTVDDCSWVEVQKFPG
jgi:hypothetical protein